MTLYLPSSLPVYTPSGLVLSWLLTLRLICHKHAGVVRNVAPPIAETWLNLSQLKSV